MTYVCFFLYKLGCSCTYMQFFTRAYARTYSYSYGFLHGFLVIFFVS